MKFEIPYIKGDSKLVLKPEPNNTSKKWFINDHCFIVDKKGVLHFFGINNPYPEDMTRLYDFHPYIGHAICTGDITKWERQPFILDESQGTEYLGAPFVTWLEKEDKYVMMFESKINGKRALELAYSDDCYNWERQNKSILTSLGYTKRDPNFLTQQGKYLIYLSNPTKEGSSVAVAETQNFEAFHNIRICLAIKDNADWGGIESPFVLKRKGVYYLFFTYAHRHYYETVVCVSDRYDAFDMTNQITTLHGHAAEIFDYNGKMYITSCGPEDRQALNKHGLYIAELGWFNN